MKILITGATGMVGSEVLRQAIAQKQFDEIFVLVRRGIAIRDQRVKLILHKDFLDYEPVKSIFQKTDVVIWCLGIPQAWATKEEYHIITYEFAVNAAKKLIEANPAARFIFLSGGGADSKEKSRILFAREKGKTENALMRLPLKSLICPRPGGIYPITKPEKVPFSYKLFYPFFPLMKFIMPGQVITSVELAKVLLFLAENGSEKVILENKELKEIAKRLSSN